MSIWSIDTKCWCWACATGERRRERGARLLDCSASPSTLLREVLRLIMREEGEKLVRTLLARCFGLWERGREGRGGMLNLVEASFVRGRGKMWCRTSDLRLHNMYVLLYVDLIFWQERRFCTIS